MEEMATEDNIILNETIINEQDPQLGSSSDKYKDDSSIRKSLEYENAAGGVTWGLNSDTAFKISKKNKFKTFPRSCFKEKDSTLRFDRQGTAIDHTFVDEPEDVESLRRKEYHISFRDQITKKPLIKIIEVESYKKYNSEGKYGVNLWWCLF